MLSLFPFFLSFQGFSPVILRLVLGLIFILWGYKIIKHTERDQRAVISSLVQFVMGGLLVIGLYTQLVAIVAAIFFAIKISEKIKKKAFLTDGVNYYLILLVVSISLLLTGPGFLAFDLPL